VKDEDKSLRKKRFNMRRVPVEAQAADGVELLRKALLGTFKLNSLLYILTRSTIARTSQQHVSDDTYKM
jgi:hypothetical protein